jgi:hypothetical protein
MQRDIHSIRVKLTAAIKTRIILYILTWQDTETVIYRQASRQGSRQASRQGSNTNTLCMYLI